jgi:hypothetical protein
VRAPKDGTYPGHTAQRRDLDLYLSGGTIELAAFGFKCGNGSATGRTGLNDIELTQTRRGFAFALRAHASVNYSDDHPEENAEVDISGRFARNGTTARGRLRVKSPRCGGTGQVAWRAKRQRGG